MIKKRLFSCLLIIFFVLWASVVCAETSGVSIGAIRWDAWCGTGSSSCLEAEDCLDPLEYHNRVPFYGTIVSDTAVQVRATSQAIIDQEIAYAKDAGIDYFAYVKYWDALGDALDFHVSSSHSTDVKIAVILDGNTSMSTAQTNALVTLFQNAAYKKVLTTRPLVYIYGGITATQVNTLSAASIAADAGDPFIVDMSGTLSTVRDATSKYSIDTHSSLSGAAYSTLTSDARTIWQAMSQGVPLVMSGWDPRPYYDNEPSWLAGTECTDGWTWCNRYYLQGTPTAIANQLLEAVNYVAAHPTRFTAMTVLIYAWNEFAEGGWICPLLPANGGSERLNAIRQVLVGIPSYTLTLSKTGTGTGTVTSNPAGINCGSTCSYSYTGGTTVTLTATAASGSTFTGWSGGGCSGTGTCTVNMTAATTVTATFMAASTSWYVNNAVASSGDGTTWATAWKNFSNIVWGSSGVKAGDTLYISGGSTSRTYSEGLTIGASGTSGNPITIRPGSASSSPSGHTGKVIITNTGGNGIAFTGKSYITIDGQYGSTRNIVLQGNGYSGLFIAGTGREVIATYLEIASNGVSESALTYEKNGVFRNTQGADVAPVFELSYCDIHDNAEDQIRVSGSAGYSQFDRVLIHHNTIYNVTNNDFLEASGVAGISVYNNELHTVKGPQTGSPHPDGIVTNGNSYVKIYNNYLHDFLSENVVVNSYLLPNAYTSTSASSVEYVYIYNNLLIETQADSDIINASTLRGIEMTDGDPSSSTAMKHFYVMNNVIVGMPWYGLSIMADRLYATIDDFKIVNNIIYNCGKRTGSTFVRMGYPTETWTTGSWGDSANVILDNNIFYNGSGSTIYAYKDTQYTYANWKTATGFQDTDISSPVDPDLDEDYKPNVTSPAIGVGRNLNTYFTLDKDGYVRSTTWDIGAYEYSGSAPDEDAPTIPANLSATALSYPQINLNWTASTDAVGVTGYQIYRCIGEGCEPTVQIAVTASTSYQDINLSPSTLYTYGVKAYDAAGNVSDMSDTDSDTTPAADTNIALGKDVSVSSTEVGSNVAANAVDGSLSTRWSSLYTDDEWIKVDLGSTYSVYKVILRWEVAYGKDYSIAVSTDDEDYTTVYTRVGGTGGAETITFTAASARYVKVTGTDRGTEWGYSLWEFEVYGTAEEEPSQNIEIEDCVLTPPVVSTADALASGGYYVKTGTASSGTAVCTFTIDTTGWYKFAVMSYGASAATDSFTVEVDSEGADTWHMNPTADPSHYGVYREDEINKEGDGGTYYDPQYDPYLVYLTAGEHTITFTGREAGARIDYLRPVAVSVTEQYTLTYTKAGTGSGTVVINGVNCSTSCSYNYDAGTPITITGTAGGDSTFTGWSGGLCEGTDPCEFSMTEARAVTGTFDLLPPLHTITVTPAGTGLGTVTSSPTGISCGSTCEFDFTEDTTIRLTPVANAGSTFTGWTGDCSGSTYFDVEEIADDVDCTATFARTTQPTTGTNFTLTFGGSVAGAAKITLVK